MPRVLGREKEIPRKDGDKVTLVTIDLGGWSAGRNVKGLRGEEVTGKGIGEVTIMT